MQFIPTQSIGSMGSAPGKVSVEQKNVCTVKPQQQQPMTYGFVHAPLENLANIASPSPVYIANQSSQYLPFQLGSSQLVPQEPRVIIEVFTLACAQSDLHLSNSCLI